MRSHVSVPLQVGLMGFSKGAYAAGIAMGLEPRISSAWLDSAPLHGLHGRHPTEHGLLVDQNL